MCELEDQLSRAGRDRLELVSYSSDENHRTFSAALKPECSICQVEVKEAVLEPCRHLAACCACADSLRRLVERGHSRAHARVRAYVRLCASLKVDVICNVGTLHGVEAMCVRREAFDKEQCAPQVLDIVDNILSLL